MNNPVAKASSHVFPWLKSYAPGVDWNIDIPDQPVYKFLDDSVEKYPDRKALVCAGHSYDYKTVGALVDCATKGLWELGVKKGTKVGLFMPNTAYSVVMYYAILKAGPTRSSCAGRRRSSARPSSISTPPISTAIWRRRRMTATRNFWSRWIFRR